MICIQAILDICYHIDFATSFSQIITSTIAATTPTSNPLRGCNVLVGATGSVASVRVPRLLNLLLDAGASVRLVSTDRARHFLTREQEVPPVIEQRGHHYTDADEWGDPNGNDTGSNSSSAVWTKLSDPVLHIELRKWADVFVIAPASANVLAKVANGLCDDLLTCVARAWPMTPSVAGNKDDGGDNYKQSSNIGDAVHDRNGVCSDSLQNSSGVVRSNYNDSTPKPKPKPLLLAPAMNTAMWEHPVTEQHVKQVTSFGAQVVVLNPIAKRLACGDVGVGAMMHVDDIVRAVVAAVASTTK